MASTPRGRFVWYDLMATDPAAAQRFYRSVTGWGTQQWDGAQQPYTMWTRGETPIGGVMRLPDEARAMGAPPHWLVYISTPDIGKTVEQAQSAGATVLVPATPIPTVGHFAVLRDPQGAVFSAYQPEGETPAGEWDPQPGDVSWHELMTSDWQAGFDFYHKLFGWQKTTAMDMGDGQMYQIFGESADRRPYGGMYDFPPGVPAGTPPNWLVYIKTADLDGALDRVRANGGQILNGPMDVPGGGRVAQCMDAQGAAFALHQEAEPAA